jgi:hypothetical protein
LQQLYYFSLKQILSADGPSKLPLRILQAYNLVEKLRKLAYFFSTLKLEKPQKKKQKIWIRFLRVSPFLMWNKGYIPIYRHWKRRRISIFLI